MMAKEDNDDNLIGTKGLLIARAMAGPRRKPRASRPTITSTYYWLATDHSDYNFFHDANDDANDDDNDDFDDLKAYYLPFVSHGMLNH